jgi:hypothetical protein
MEKFLNSFKKETVKAKKDGNLDEQEADPISWSLFRLMLGWLLSARNVFVWVYSILQWNCMARSINICILGLHNFRLGKNLLLLLDCYKAEHSAVFSMHQSSVSLNKEKLWWAFLGSYDAGGDGHCAAIQSVEKMLAKNSFPTLFIHAP